MDETILLVTVMPDGSAGELMGTINYADGLISADTKVASQTVAQLRRRSQLPDDELFTTLASDGWSNGALMLVTQGPVTASDSPDLDTRSDENFREYWVHGEGALKIRWPQPGAFKRCVRQLSKYSKGGTAFDPEGLCAEYYREAKGYWPGSKSHDHTDMDTDMDIELAPDTDGYDVEAEAEPCAACVMEPQPGEMWHGVAHTEGRSTGKRVWLPGALSWREPPFAFHWQTKSSAHGGTPETVQVGTVTRMERIGDEVHAWGNIDVDDPYGAEFARKLLGGFITGISMGPGDEKIEYEAIYPADAGLGMGEGPDEWVFTDYPIGELTAVSVPAQAGAYIEPLPGLGELLRPMVASAAGLELDGDDGEEGIVTASGSSWTIEIPDLPPPEWFEEPDCEPGLAVTVTDEGRIFGYVAPKHTAHRSYWRNGERKTLASLPPTDFSRWQKETIVAGGGRVLAGPVTMECMHAPTQGYGTLDRRHQYYEDSCSVIARAAVGDNEHGRWIAGAMMPGVTAEQFLKFMACDVSLDQQPHPEKPGWQDFVGVLAVPVGGWPKERHETSVPVVRVREDENGPVIVASAVPVRHERGEEMDDIITAAAGGCPACAPQLHTCKGEDGQKPHRGPCRGWKGKKMAPDTPKGDKPFKNTPRQDAARLREVDKKIAALEKRLTDENGPDRRGWPYADGLDDLHDLQMEKIELERKGKGAAKGKSDGDMSDEKVGTRRGDSLAKTPVKDMADFMAQVAKNPSDKQLTDIRDGLKGRSLRDLRAIASNLNRTVPQDAPGYGKLNDILDDALDAAKPKPRKSTEVFVDLPVMYAAAGIDPTAMIRESMLAATSSMGGGA